MLTSQIHHQICQVYGDNAMGDGKVRKWVRMFNEGRQNVHCEARSGGPSLANAGLVRKVNERVRDDTRFTISDLSLHFPQISRTLVYDIVNSLLGYYFYIVPVIVYPPMQHFTPITVRVEKV